MRSIILNNGVEMPLIGFGTYKITNAKECEQSVITAVHAGYRLIDTAQAYGNEAAVGAGIRHCDIPREELFVTTKLWFRSYETEDAEKALLVSLKNLGL